MTNKSFQEVAIEILEPLYTQYIREGDTSGQSFERFVEYESKGNLLAETFFEALKEHYNLDALMEEFR
jgi:hypothetical protein